MSKLIVMKHGRGLDQEIALRAVRATGGWRDNASPEQVAQYNEAYAAARKLNVLPGDIRRVTVGYDRDNARRARGRQRFVAG